VLAKTRWYFNFEKEDGDFMSGPVGQYCPLCTFKPYTPFAQREFFNVGCTLYVRR
jgi:hypothetical protein